MGCRAASGANGSEEGPRGGHEDAGAAAKDKAVKMAILQRTQPPLQQQQQQLAQVTQGFFPILLHWPPLCRTCCLQPVNIAHDPAIS